LLDGDAFHIHSAPAPYLAVDDDSRERIHLPRFAIHRNDIEMIQQQQRLLRAIFAGDARDEVGLPRRPAGVERDLDSGVFQNALDEIRGLGRVGGRVDDGIRMYCCNSSEPIDRSVSIRPAAAAIQQRVKAMPASCFNYIRPVVYAQSHHFREYDIRGLADVELLDADVEELGRPSARICSGASKISPRPRLPLEFRAAAQRSRRVWRLAAAR
jgi:hypothetical protein